MGSRSVPRILSGRGTMWDDHPRATDERDLAISTALLVRAAHLHAPRGLETKSERRVWVELRRDVLQRCLMAHENTIKKRACVRLDAPGSGRRFVREHGPCLAQL